ncbi:MAG: class I SAM-dependent methyltransferase [Deltaproteobacteria bacterium]|nr:class I SAM-dependent methyltransferase [Deltaproteobacteria bacterium]
MWDERFVKPGYYYGTEANDFLKEMSLRFKPGGRVLCLAEGEGRNAVFLAEQGFVVTAVDGSEAGMKKMDSLAKDRGVRVEGIVCDLGEFEFGDRCWDAVVMIWCHLPKSLMAQVLDNSARSLTLGGYIVIEAYTPLQLQYKTGGPHAVELLNTLEEFDQGLKQLERVHGVEIERDVLEGQGHTGRSAVVQYLARRTS